MHESTYHALRLSDLVVVLDPHAERVDENGDENSSLETVAVDESFHFQSSLTQTACDHNECRLC